MEHDLFFLFACRYSPVDYSLYWHHVVPVEKHIVPEVERLGLQMGSHQREGETAHAQPSHQQSEYNPEVVESFKNARQLFVRLLAHAGWIQKSKGNVSPLFAGQQLFRKDQSHSRSWLNANAWSHFVQV